MNISLKSKHALIGGSSKGLGLAVAKQLAHSGAKVTIVARSENLLIQTINELQEETDCKHEYIVVDYNNHEKYKKVITEYIEKNTIDILVNNTQGPKAGDVNSVSIDDYQESFDLLFKNIVFTSMLALEKMKKNNWGRIINMVSVFQTYLDLILEDNKVALIGIIGSLCAMVLILILIISRPTCKHYI